MAKKPNGSANTQLCGDSAKTAAVGNRLGPCLEEINAVAARVVNGVVGSGTDANHAAFGHRLLLLVLTPKGFDMGVDPTTGELQAELLGAAGGEQAVHVEPREAINQDQRGCLGCELIANVG